MATWSDKQLRAHKRAQGYVSATGATLGIAALGAAGVKTGVGRRGALKLARLSNHASPQAGAKVVRGQRKIGGAVSGLTVGSAGVGGVGGYNFAAIQSQESRRKVAKAIRLPKAAYKQAEEGWEWLGKAPLKRGVKIAGGVGAGAAVAGAAGGTIAYRRKVTKSVWGVDHGPVSKVGISTLGGAQRAASIAVHSKPTVRRAASMFPQGGMPRKPIMTSGGGPTMVLKPVAGSPKPSQPMKPMTPKAITPPQSSPGGSMKRPMVAVGAAGIGAGAVGGYAAGRRRK